jgi:MFS family permease
MVTNAHAPLPDDRDAPVAAPPRPPSLLSYLRSTFWVISPTGKSRYIYPGWWQVFISSCLTFFSAPFGSYFRSVLLRALQDAFHYTPVQLSFLTVLAREEGAVLSPIIGWALDRFGPRWVNAVGWIAYGSGYIMLPLLYVLDGNIIWMYFALTLNTMGSATQYPSMYKDANTWFVKNRGMAIGGTILGSGFGTPLVIPVAAFLVTLYGWGATVVFVGTITMIVGVGCTALAYRNDKPEDVGLLPDNEPVKFVPRVAAVAAATETAGEAAPKTALKDFGIREAMRNRAFWLYTIGTIIIALGGSANFSSFQSIRLREVGFSLEAAALYFGLSFIFTQVGRILCVAVSDLIHPALGWGLSKLAMAAGIFCFANASNSWWLWGYVIFYGIGDGYSIPATAILIGGLFGRQSFGRLSGINSAISAVIGIPGPLVFGYVRELTGDYYLPYVFMAAATAAGAMVTMFAKTPQGQIEPGRRNSGAAAH